MLEAVRALTDKMAQLEASIERCRDLLKKKRKDIQALRARNEKRPAAAKAAGRA